MKTKKRKIAVLFGGGVLLIWSLLCLGMGQAFITDYPVPSVIDYTVPENRDIGTNVGDPIPVKSDLEGAILRYSIAKGADLPTDDYKFFSIDSETAQLKTAVVFDYETVTYSDPRGFDLILDVQEYLGQDLTAQVDGYARVFIKVTDVTENPPPITENTPPVTENPPPVAEPPPPVVQPPDPTPEPEPKIVIVRPPSQCGVGWAPQSPYGHVPEKVMIYALEFEFINGNYTCSAIEIRTGDATLSHLEGWQLSLGTLYDPVGLPITLTQENSQITDQMLRLTPESLGGQTFLCGTLFLSGQPLPSLRYELRNENNIPIDRAYSCYLWGQIAFTPERHISPRRISSQALLAMDPPRIERYLQDPTNVFITYIDFAAFGWDRVVRSDWLLAASEASDVDGGNAPSFPYKQLTTSWGALKLEKTDRRHKKSR